MDLVFEGEARRVADTPTLKAIAALYREGGWPVQVDGDGFTAPYSAPSAGPPPWHLFRLTAHTVFGVAGAEPHGATRWRFSRASLETADDARHDASLSMQVALGATVSSCRVLGRASHCSSQAGPHELLLGRGTSEIFAIWIFPPVIGTGSRLFGEGTIPAAPKLVDSRIIEIGVTSNTDERAGDIDRASFALDEPTEAEIQPRRLLADGRSPSDG